MFTRVLDRVENTSNFQQIPVTPATMEGQLFWHLEIRQQEQRKYDFISRHRSYQDHGMFQPFTTSDWDIHPLSG